MKLSPRNYLAPLSVLLLGLSGCSSPASKQAETPVPEQHPSIAPIGTLAPGEPLTALPVEADDAQLGAASAKVTVVGFLDFQCGFCARGFQTLLDLRKEFKDDELRIVFKHLPLEFHEQAVPAAIVGQAVQLHAGNAAFFQFAEQVFSNQSDLDLNHLATWAEQAGVDLKQFNQAVSSQDTLQRVIDDAQLASRIGVDATPTFFINGARLAGAQPIEVFRAAIQQELSQMANVNTEQFASAYKKRVTENMNVSLVDALLEADPRDYRLPIDGSPVQGSDSALVTMVMFSDYECPFCKHAEQTVKELQNHYGNRLRVVFKQMPLPFHEHARPAALLASAVQLKSGDAAFWKISRELFEVSPHLDSNMLRSLGEKYGLSSVEIDQVLSDSHEQASARLDRDADLGDDVLARGTPHFFINGKRLDGARPIEQFEALIDYEEKRAKALVDKGVTASAVYATLQKDAIAPGAPTTISHQLTDRGFPAQGPADAPVVIHVFSDFECPYCRKGELLLAQLGRLYPGELRIVWHDFPLPFHDRALPLARAGRAAYEQKGSEGFWKLHDAIFALTQPAPVLGTSEVAAAATTAGLDGVAIERAMKDEKYDAQIEADQELADSLGISGTPAFVIGDYLVTGAKPLNYMRRVVELVLKDHKAKSAAAPTSKE